MCTQRLQQNFQNIVPKGEGLKGGYSEHQYTPLTFSSLKRYYEYSVIRAESAKMGSKRGVETRGFFMTLLFSPNNQICENVWCVMCLLLCIMCHLI